MTWTFDLSSRPFDDLERAVLAPDLEALGSDGTLLQVWGATVSVRSALTRPRVLRAHDGGALVGAAVVIVCRDFGRSFFSSRPAYSATRISPPIWYWERAGLGTDGHSGPGVVAAGVRREDFVVAAVQWLRRRFVAGTVVEAPQEPARPGQLDWPGTGVSTVSLRGGDRAALLSAHRNLPRKVRRFAARGGRVERHDGPLPRPLLDQLLSTYRLGRPINPPFVELYPRMVTAHCSIRSDRLVHLVARIADDPVGYHSFWRSGSMLSLLSGAFSRPPGGTAHAYENVLLGALDLAEELGVATVDLGPTVNPVKAALLDQAPTRVRFVTGLAPVRWGLAAVLPRSRLAPGHVSATLGQGR